MESLAPLSKTKCSEGRRRISVHISIEPPGLGQLHFFHGSSPVRCQHQPGKTARLPHRRRRHIPSPSILFQISKPFPHLKRMATLSLPMPHSRPSTIRASLPANWFSLTTLGSKSTLSAGAPGVRSARFAADAGLVDSPDANDNTDVWNNMVLLQRLDGVPAAQRTARYRCVLVAARDGEPLHSADGAVEGLVLESPRGTGGFGYDPLFFLPELDRTMAEIDLETKLSLSHRGRALAALLPTLISSRPDSTPI